MVASADLSPSPPSTNPYVSALTAPYAFRSGYVVTYRLQGNPGDSAPNGGALWAQANAAAAFGGAAQAWAAVANITIRAATASDGANVTWIEKLGGLDSDTLGEHDIPGQGQMSGAFNNTLSVFTAANNAPGGYSFLTFLHEIGHGLGLLHPHEEGHAFPGVSGETSVGDNGLNQALYTVMSYNDAMEGALTQSDAWGWSMTPMAFDIATIQGLYGANMTTATGDTVYRLPSASGAGTGWQCIWDAGGTDTISASGNGGNTIDLRPATLLDEFGGGGFMSFATGVAGGFTIANGVLIENATGGTGDDVIRGNAGDNRLVGGGGRDTIDGFGGNDRLEGSGTLSGGDGDDAILTSGPGNTVYGGAGDDRLDGWGQFDGGDGNDVIHGGGGSGFLFAGLYGGAGDDRLFGGDGTNVISGGLGADTLTGGSGNDTLDGGAGVDVMTGGYGDDTYTIDDRGDRVVELDGQGTDTVQSLFDYVLEGSIENGRLIGLDAVSLTGNALNNQLFGSDYANVIDGGAGTDTMAGGYGDDSYSVDNAGDVVTDYAGAGFDVVYASVSYTLSDLPADSDPYAGAGVIYGGRNEIERLVLTGSGDMTGRGNVGNNEIVGNTGNDQLYGAGGNDAVFGGAGNDWLDGGDGTDRMAGGPGDDTYVVAEGADVLVEDANAGTDTVRTALQAYRLGDNIENLVLTGSGQSGTGNALDNRMGGSTGNDILTGGAGNDRIDGGTGQDRAVFAGAFHQARLTVTSDHVDVASADGRDTAFGIEQFSFVDSVFVLDANSAGAQVQRMYDTVLGRGVDAGGLDYWVDRIEDDGRNLSAVADALAGSAEFRQATGGLGNAAFVDYVYTHALGRGADANGRDYWTAQLNGGLARGDMLVLFSEGTEHRARTAALVGQGYVQSDDVAQAVALLYDSAVGRLPDAGGLGYWTGQIKAGSTLANVAYAFAGLPEFTAATQGKTNAQVVDFMYRNTLDRLPDAQGNAYWTDRLDAGLSRADLLLIFSQGAEHAQLYAPHITGGIDVLM